LEIRRKIVLTTLPSKHKLVEWQEKRIHTLLHSQSSEPARAAKQEPPTSLLSNDGKSQSGLHEHDGRRKPLIRKYPSQKKPNKRLPLTVCIAAICEWQGQPMIVGASDRMLTAGDIEFESKQSKIFLFNATQRSVCLIAGEHSEATFVCLQTQKLIDGVDDIAKIAAIHAEQMASRRVYKAERKYLSPLRLTAETFIDKQRVMRPDRVHELTIDMQQEDLGVEFIIAGTDATGANLYVIDDPGLETCRNGVAYAAIGMGARHAESIFSLNQYTRKWSADAALCLAYQAKRQAELAPSVGRWTDLFFIPMSPGHYARASDEFIDALLDKFNLYSHRTATFYNESRKDIIEHVAGLLPRTETPQPPQIGVSPPDPVSNG
jgi:hypothetical protein